MRASAGPLLLGAVLGIWTAPEIQAGGLAIVETVLQDNGDGDGFADTNETVRTRIGLKNATGSVLSRATLHVSSTSPALACLGRRTVALGTLEPDEVRAIELVFTVGDVDRESLGLDALGPLSAAIDLRVVSDSLTDETSPPSIVLDLDLDASGGAGPRTFAESFESGLGAFEIENLDFGRHGPAADGYRCQYHDPDLPSSNNHGIVPYCYLGANPAHADRVHWSVDQPSAASHGRAYTGIRSLYYGVDLGPPQGQTTPLGVLEAVKTSAPVYLGHAVTPVLSFKHQVGLQPAREDAEANDRAVVMVQLADSADRPVGPWIKVHPFANSYDRLGGDQFFDVCTFDPVDDASTEDDFFDPSDPLRNHGPSSTCNPERVFMNMGATDGPFDPERLGAAEGPGLAGALGPGTWVESRVDLSRFRGQRVRVRFLATSTRIGTSPIETWEQIFHSNPDPMDDGWWIDDVEIDGALTEPASVAADPRPNNDLPGRDDLDADDVFASCDNCADDANSDQADSDADGVGNACDGCPFEADADQEDADGDGLGDACDPCPDGDIADTDRDGRACRADNCPLDANADQLDADADGRGDPCDVCPLDAANDGDGDGTCAEADTCPTAFNDDPSRGVRISGPSPVPGGDVWTGPFWVAPHSRHVVYAGDPDADGRLELFAVGLDPLGIPRALSPPGTGTSFSFPPPQFTVDGSRVVFRWQSNADTLDLLSAPLAGGETVRLAVDPRSFEISPDGSTVLVHKVSPPSLAAVPITGGAPVTLNGPLVEGGSISAYRLTSDGSRVVYVADQETGGVDELYCVPIEGGLAIRLNRPLPVGGDVSDDFQFDPQGTTVVFRSDQEGVGNTELWSVPVEGGDVVRLNGPLVAGGDVAGFPSDVFDISPDGATVVYIADQATNDVFELWSVPIQGGEAVRLNASLVTGGDVGDFDLSSSITPDSATVVYPADQDVNGVLEVYAVPIGGGTATRLHPPLASGERVYAYKLSPDGSRVATVTDRLHSAAVTGGAIVRLDGGLHVDPWVDSFEFTPDGMRIVFSSAGAPYSVPSAGGEPIALADPTPPSGVFQGWEISSSAPILVYKAITHGDEGFELFAVPVAGGPSSRLSASLVSGGSVGAYALTEDGSRAIYVADQVADELFELFGSDLEPDADGDGVLSFCECDDHDPSSRPGAVDLPGDTLDQDCDGILVCDPTAPHASHGQFAACVAREAGALVGAGQISQAERSALVRDAARSGAGKRFR